MLVLTSINRCRAKIDSKNYYQDIDKPCRILAGMIVVCSDSMNVDLSRIKAEKSNPGDGSYTVIELMRIACDLNLRKSGSKSQLAAQIRAALVVRSEAMDIDLSRVKVDSGRWVIFGG